MKKILEFSGEPITSGGQEAFINNVITNIDMFGLSIDLYTPYSCENELYKQNVLDRGGQVFAARLPFTPGKSRRNIIAPFLRHLDEHHYDVVHIHSGSVSVLAYIAQAAKKRGVKRIIVHSHRTAEHETLTHMLIMRATQKIMKSCPTDYWACSMQTAKETFTKKIMDSKKVLIIKNSIELERYAFNADTRQRIRDSLGIPDDAFVVGHVGRFTHQKNHKFILALFAAFLKERGNARLILVGDGEMMAEIKDMAARNGLTDHVSFLGNISNVDEVLQAMDAFVLPSFFEGLPVVGVEAQAAGLPTLVSEKITEELKLTDSVRYLPIDGVQPWVDVLMSLESKPRYDNTSILREKGFDIRETTNFISRVYGNQGSEI